MAKYPYKFKFVIHIQGDERANDLYDENGEEIYDLEKAKEIAQKRFPDDAWEVHNGAEVYYNEKYDKEEDERRINA